MSIWKWLLRRPAKQEPSKAAAPAEPAGTKQPIRLPTEPSVFECRTCHKVFEARRLRPSCPECDSPDVELMSA
jgi:Zn finger protein HypA/HybF involved in hydrogenase expression